MLVLERFNGQSILVGNDVIVTIFNASCGRARVGIKAPKEVKILREELLTESQGQVSPIKLVETDKIVA